MVEGLLEYSLERIDSLQNFYESEKENIDKKSREGMKKCLFGFLADRYFSRLGISSEENSDEQLSLKKRLENFIEVLSTQEDGMLIYRIKNANELRQKGYELDLQKASRQYRQFADMPIIHGNNTLIMLITRFEEFLSIFFHELYGQFPQKYLDNQTVKFSDIAATTIEEVKELIIARQVDLTMRENYIEWIKILSSHHLNFDAYKEEIEILKELYARRNIIVHNTGKVNPTYLLQVGKCKYKVGDVLSTDSAYLYSAFNAINTIIIAIMIEAVKLTQCDKHKYLERVFNISFDKLCEEQYKLCSKTFKSLSGNKCISSRYKILSQINYWIAKKELDGLKAIKQDVVDYDMSAYEQSFQMARLILLEQYEEAYPLLESLYDKKDIFPPSIENWPLFKHFRETTFYTKFKENHGEDFNTATFEVETDKTTDISSNEPEDESC